MVAALADLGGMTCVLCSSSDKLCIGIVVLSRNVGCSLCVSVINCYNL